MIKMTQESQAPGELRVVLDSSPGLFPPPPQVLKDHLVPRVTGPVHFGAEDDMTY